MIRLIVIFIGIFLVGLWIVSPFTRRTKKIVTLVSVAAAIALIAWETYDNKPRQGLVEADQLSVCGIDVKHSYRTDYNVELCVDNTSPATVKRIHFSLTAQRCSAGKDCEELASVTRSMPVTIDANTRIELSQTLRFDTLNPDQEQDLTWALQWLEIKAIP